tara:strand:+ start:7426 stop:9627 length:2202 start_codon:yes stop_codon:yes gene_type:complete
MLPAISSEQKHVVDELFLNHNVIVESVAGSGKTTCSLYIAKQFESLNILLLTYNARLKSETREKVSTLRIPNIEVHSYHSFCVKHYDNTCFTDTNISLMLNSGQPLLNQIKYDIIILDEAQDISPLYYELFCKLYRDNGGNAQICIFGDIKQSIFEFNHADFRYIQLADELFNLHGGVWTKCKLSQSFRITHEMSLFLNRCMLNDDRILSSKVTTNKPRYIICNCFGEGKKNRPFDEVKYYLDMGYLPQDIFILAPSIKSQKSPVRELENKIKRDLSIPIFVSTSEDEKLDKEILEGKLVFSTFHQTKGLERKVIIIFSFDNSYFEFYKKNQNTYVCPNELYVATTRGLEHLSVLHHYQSDYLPFINKNRLQVYCDVEYNKSICLPKKPPNPKLETSPTALLRHVPGNILDDCFRLLESTTVLHKKLPINIPTKSMQPNGCEGVSDITGVAIPSLFEFKIKGTSGILNELLSTKFEDEIQNTGHKYNLNKIKLHTITPDELLYLATCWTAYTSGFLFKIFQIQEYNWLSNEHLLESVTRMQESLHISPEAIFEKQYTTTNEPELLNIKLTGFVDCIDNRSLYEFKCVQTLEKEHFLQLAIYMYQHETHKRQIIAHNNLLMQPFIPLNEQDTSYYLYNILTDELLQITCPYDKLIKLVETLIYYKYIQKKVISNDTFLLSNQKLKHKYMYPYETTELCYDNSNEKKLDDQHFDDQHFDDQHFDEQHYEGAPCYL